MDLQLAGDVAVVLGGASGLGRAVAWEFAREQAAVALVDISPSVHEVAAQLQRETNARTLAITADAADFAAVEQTAQAVVAELFDFWTETVEVAVVVASRPALDRWEGVEASRPADFAAVERTAQAVLAELGRCDHVVVAAGIGSGKFGFPFWNLQPTDWPRVLHVNIMAPVHAAQAFSPSMIQRRRGTFLFFSSIAGQIGSQTDPPYSAAKAAVINFGQCAAKDLAPYNIRVNLVCPGMIKTPLNRAVWQAWYDRQPTADRLSYEAWADDKVRRISPLGRWQTPEDIAAVAVFLASVRAQNITGQTINVDGGQVMHA